MTDLRARIQAVNAITNRQAVRLLDDDENTALVFVTDMHGPPDLVQGHLTATTDGDDGFVVASYDRTAWDAGVPDALLYLDTTDEVVNACGYLLTEQPEGTDWSAWAAQRISDAGAELGQP